MKLINKIKPEVLNALENKTNRKAQFKTVIALNLHKEQQLFTGSKGKIECSQKFRRNLL